MKRNNFNIILIGPPGAGKGTQANLLKDKYNLEHLEPGDMLREIIQRQGRLGKKISRIVNQGKLVPTFLIMNLIKLRIQSIREDQGIIFDGSPRRLREAIFLEKLLKKFSRKINYVFYLKVSEEESIKRLLRRRTCQKCDRTFTIGRDISPEEKYCPLCGGKLYQRKDDTLSKIKKRWKVYLKETLPVVKYFSQKKKIFYQIDGEQSIEKVFIDITSIIEKNS